MTAPRLIDPSALMRIRSLELRARAVVEGFWSGLHRSPYHGFSVEFSEYRQYSPGDDPRHLDWRVFARTDRDFIRRFEDETNLRVQLVVDLSRSMTFGRDGLTKAAYAATLAATLAWFLHQQGDAVGLLSFDEGVRDYLPARHRHGHLRQLLLALEKPPGGAATDLAAPLRRTSELLRKRGLVVVISDFLAPLEPLQKELPLLAAAGQELVLFQVLDPAETTFELGDASLFRDLETGRLVYVDPAAARAGYLARFEEHSAALRRLCDQSGITFRRLTTDRPLELALFDFLQDRRARGRSWRTRRNTSGRAVA